MSLTRRRALALAGGTLATPFLVRPAGAQAKVTLSFLHYQTGAAGQTPVSDRATRRPGASVRSRAVCRG
jgi:hypothetical protein